MSYHQFIFVPGLAILTAAFYAALRSLYEAIKLYVCSGFVDKKPLRSYGKWAVITGGSDGIGKAMAKEIAESGLNLCFIARNEEKMQKVSHDIQKECNVETRVIIADLSDTSPYEHVQSKLEEIDDIGILVNCAGVIIKNERVLETDFKDCMDLINTNVSATVWMVQIVAPKMVANGKGLILNVGSIVSELNGPGAALYAASKCFISSFTESLEHELRPSNVRVKYIMPGFVRTKLVNNHSFGLEVANITCWAWLTPESYAKTTVASMKIADSPRVIIGHFYHWMSYWIFRFLILGADNRPMRLEAVWRLVLRVKGFFHRL